ncbi:hypothetical protein CP533_1977 [Ophiocordyceps camponoti-saundersi (nom. inval.)]|nr:hypothetical protein CP533_1977 [Ophiocordyceps camponoti-saundersi (nom. inval.)]
MSGRLTTAFRVGECDPDCGNPEPPLSTDLPGGRPRPIAAKAVPLNIAAATKGAPILSPSSPPTTPSMCVIHGDSPPSPPSPPSPSPASISHLVAYRTELRRDLSGQDPPDSSRRNTPRTSAKKGDTLQGSQDLGPKGLSKKGSAQGSSRDNLVPTQTSTKVRNLGALGSQSLDLQTSPAKSARRPVTPDSSSANERSTTGSRSSRDSSSTNDRSTTGSRSSRDSISTNDKASANSRSSKDQQSTSPKFGKKASTPTPQQQEKPSSDKPTTNKPTTNNRSFLFPFAPFAPFAPPPPFLKRPDDKPTERTVEQPAAETTSRLLGKNNPTRSVNNQPPLATSTTTSRQPGQNQVQPPGSTSASGRDTRSSSTTERAQPTSRVRSTRTRDSVPTSGIQEAPIETSESQTAVQETSTSSDDRTLATSTNESTSTSTEQPTSTSTEQPTSTSTEQPTSTSTEQSTSTSTEEPTSTTTDEPTSTTTDEPNSTSRGEQTSTTENPLSFGSSTSTATESSSDGGITSASPLRVAPTDSTVDSNPRNTRRPFPAVRSTLDTSASALPASKPTAKPSSAGPLGDTGTENGIGGNLQNQGSDRPAKTSPRPSPLPSDASRGSRPLPAKSVVGIVMGVAGAVLILGLALWIGRKVWRKVQAKKRINRLPSPFHDSSSSDIGQRDVREAFGDVPAARFGTVSMGYHGAGARSQAENSMAEVNVNGGAPQLWETSAIPGQGMANWGASVKDRFIGLWPRRPGDTDFEAAPRGGLPDGTANMGSGSANAVPQNLELPLNQDGFGILNPFADSNAMNVTTQEPAYLAQAYMEGALDPFSDASVIQSPQEAAFPPGNESRSHRRSVSASAASSRYPPSVASTRSSRYPPSVASTRSSRYPASLNSRTGGRSSFRSLASSFADRRNKFRSDPFDLEIEGGLPNVDDVPEMPPLDNSNAAYMSHMRAGSHPTSSSHYTSGIGSDWNLTRTTAAGPAIDPAAAAAFPLGQGAGGEAHGQSGEGTESGLR